TALIVCILSARWRYDASISLALSRIIWANGCHCASCCAVMRSLACRSAMRWFTRCVMLSGCAVDLWLEAAVVWWVVEAVGFDGMAVVVPDAGGAADDPLWAKAGRATPLARTLPSSRAGATRASSDAFMRASPFDDWLFASARSRGCAVA